MTQHRPPTAARYVRCMISTRQLHTFDSGLAKPELLPFNEAWYPALVQARKEYLLERMAAINLLPPAEANVAMSEFNDADLGLLGLKRMDIRQ